MSTTTTEETPRTWDEVHPVSECGEPPGPEDNDRSYWGMRHPSDPRGWRAGSWFHRLCSHCGLGMHTQRRDTKFCSVRCRVAAYRARQ